MSSRLGGTSCRLTGSFGSDGWYSWGGEKYLGDLIFWIARYSWRVSWCLRSLYIVAILWNMIQDIIGSICVAHFFLELDTFTNPVHEFLVWISWSPSLSFTCLISTRQYLRDDFLCYYHQTGAWRPWKLASTDMKYNYSQRVSHGHLQYMIMKLSMNPRIDSGKSANLLSSWVTKTLNFF